MASPDTDQTASNVEEGAGMGNGHAHGGPALPHSAHAGHAGHAGHASHAVHTPMSIAQVSDSATGQPVPADGVAVVDTDPT